MTDYIKRSTAMRPIDANAVYNKALENRQKGEIEDWEFDSIVNYLAGAPTINVAEIVYCKDCKYGSYDSKPDGAMVCLRTNDGFWRKETDFCSYGEYQTNTGGVTHE